jgi:hypothetical protein
VARLTSVTYSCPIRQSPGETARTQWIGCGQQELQVDRGVRLHSRLVATAPTFAPGIEWYACSPLSYYVVGQQPTVLLCVARYWIANMPRKKYKAIDLLTVPTRTPADSAWSPAQHDSRLFTFNVGPSSRDRGQPPPPTPGEDPQEPSALGPPRDNPRGLLHYLQFGGSQPELKIPQPATSFSSLEDTPAIYISLDSDFPPLHDTNTKPGRHDSEPSPRRCVTTSQVPLWLFGNESLHHSVWSTGSRNLDKAPSDTDLSCIDSFGTQFVSEFGASGTDSWPVDQHSTRRDTKLDFTDTGVPTDRHDMAAAYAPMSGDARRHYPAGSNRYENRAPVNRQTTCKNGPLCRKYQEG